MLFTLIVKQNDGMHTVMGTCTSCAFVFRNPWQRKVIYTYPHREMGSTFLMSLNETSHIGRTVSLYSPLFALSLLPPHAKLVTINQYLYRSTNFFIMCHTPGRIYLNGKKGKNGKENWQAYKKHNV